MKAYQKPLLAGVAVLAIMAGTGFASAQAQNGAPQSGAPQADQQHATQPTKGKGPGTQAQRQGGPNRTVQNAKPEMQRNGKGPGVQAQGQGKPNATARNGNRGLQHNAKTTGRVGPSGAEIGMGRTPRQAQTINRSSKTGKAGIAANERRMEHGRHTTAQRQRILRGLQGNASGQMQGKGPQGAGQASGAGVRLSDQQRTRIQQTIIDARNAPRVGHVDFDVRVGTVIPRERIHIVPVPETLVRIEPRWRGLLYFVYADEVVIVNPRDMRIVAVLPV